MPLSSRTQSLLTRLAQQHGQKSAPTPVASGDVVDFGRLDQLVSLDEPHVQAELEHEVAHAERHPQDALRALLSPDRADRPVAFLPTLEDAFARLLAERKGRVVAVGGALAFAGAHPAIERVAFDAAAAERVRGAALVVFEPDDARLLRLKHLELAAHEAGCAVALDATRVSYRAGASLLPGANGVTADYVLFGSSVFAGLPLHALVGADGGPVPDAATCAAACAVLRALRAQPPATELARTFARLGEAIAREAKEQEIRVSLQGLPSMPNLVFDGQEDAPGELIAQHFAREIDAVGVRLSNPMMLPAALRTEVATFERTCRAFAHAMVRIRALLVEYNSHLSGGLAWPFRTGRDALRTRGLTFYRFPRRAEVDVAANGDAMRIAFGKSQLGSVTSSGFFVPTRLVGDVTLTIRYALRKWNSGPDSACLGLFFQNEASTARYYAQVMSTHLAPTARDVAAGLAGNVVGRRRIEGDEGWLRLSRTGKELVASWRGDAKAAWVELGRCPATPDALVAGCKIWSKVATDGLVADLFELDIDGELAKEQPELLPARPDPRHA